MKEYPTKTMADYFAHTTAVIDAGAKIGAGTKIWHFAHIFGGSDIGMNCSFGQNTMVASGVKIGDNVKVQNNVAVYAGTTIEDDVFLGPSCVLTNVSNPRSQVIRREVYEKTKICRGATIGANATIVCGVTIGLYAFIGAGAVVTKDVPNYAMIVGVPGKQTGWMSRHGQPLLFGDDGKAVCPESQLRYQKIVSDQTTSVHCLDLSELEALPEQMSVGSKSYRDFQAQRQAGHD